MKDAISPENGWIEISPRIEIPSSKNQSWLFKSTALTSKWLGRDEIPDIFKLLSLHPSLFWPWLHFASKLMPYGKLSARVSELVILRVAWLCRCRYEWGQHIEIGQRRAKLSDEDIYFVSLGSTKFESEKDRAIILACDQLVLNKLIHEENWKILQKYWSDAQIIELQMLIGHYAMLAGLINSAGLKLEDSIEKKLQKFNERIEQKI